MGFMDKLKAKAVEVKEKAVEAVDEHGPQIKEGIGKAGSMIDKKTKGKYSDKIAMGTKKAEEAVDKSSAPTPGGEHVTPPVPPPSTPAPGSEGHHQPHPAAHTSPPPHPHGDPLDPQPHTDAPPAPPIS